jgi:excisionase family DNA binding protein
MAVAYQIGDQQGSIVPTAADERIAEELERVLDRISDNEKARIQIRVQPEHQAEQTIPISLSHFRLLAYLVTELARGHGISLIPMEAELTTNEAARQLKVSRPYLIRLLEKGEIPFRKVGSHRRIRFRDLMAYKQRTDQNRLEALEELSALDQEYGLSWSREPRPHYGHP